ncbi:hypothetical protein [Stieleria varia]|uniref:Uncharacterized protein n=1 Tax=Stieleria varia TaxID=2528005 RepID=A0A5C6B320_9BACT|nr:hypothetical protein [Stieleria varia]TWU06523.1 hypothetical protein Pla52n_22450 [Stieleria varia]
MDNFWGRLKQSIANRQSHLGAFLVRQITSLNQSLLHHSLKLVAGKHSIKVSEASESADRSVKIIVTKLNAIQCIPSQTV